jgi:hypothetical protein
METNEITDPLFRSAVEAIDKGNIARLGHLIEEHPYLVTERLSYPEGGYFRDPYLLWFIADNPIRNGRLAKNIVEVTALLIERVKSLAADNWQEQLDYALGLVTTGRTPRESGVQLKLMDLLINAGAHPGNALGALANGNEEAARHLLKHGAKLDLATAVVLAMTDDVDHLLPHSTRDEQLVAITAAAFYGNAEAVKLLLDNGVDPNGYPDASGGFHSHGTPLHQAVSSGSLECVRLLTEAGASLKARDKIYDGTPLDWAEYMQRDAVADDAKKNFALIGEYLQKQPEK